MLGSVEVQIMAFDSENLYLNRAKFVMKVFGIWVPLENEGYLRKFHRTFAVFTQYLLLLFQIIYVIQVWGDLDAVSEASYILFTQACLCWKVTVFFLNMDMVEDLLRQMGSETFQPQSEKHEKSLEFQAMRIKRFLLAFVTSAQLTCVCWALKPLFDEAGSRNFPLDMWMPVSPEKSPHYQIGYACQYLTVSASAYMYFAVDSVALSSLIFGCAQLDIIKEKMLSIKSCGKKTGLDLTETLDDNYKKLVECIKHHQAIIAFIRLLEKAFHTYLLFQLTGSVGLICMSALKLVVVHWRSMQFFSTLIYLSVMVSQLYVCCWCGHELTATSEDLHRSTFQCIWYEQSLKFKRDLMFVVMRMQRPLVFKVGHYVALQRQTFVAILRLSYSYFAVLNQTT